MVKSLLYIDQNVVGLHIEKHIKLTKLSSFYWVYSKEHFAEINRSSHAERYLEALEFLDAKLLDLELGSDEKFTGCAQLIEHGTPSQHYDSYIRATSEEDSSENLFDPFVVWLNGGGEEGSLRKLPDQLAEQITVLTTDLPEINSTMCSTLESITPDFAQLIENLIEYGNDISETRKAMGDGRGAVGDVKGENQIQQIWNIIGRSCPGVTCDQFFGFDPTDKQGYESWPVHLGIINCCAVMDIVGFQAEKKCRKVEKLANVRSDARHIAMGAFCSAILSEDKRLIRRATAIYQYKNIGTIPMLLTNNMLRA